MHPTVENSIHASCVALRQGWFARTGLVANGVLLLGPSGSGKSDLALRLVNRGAWLVADDRVLLIEKSGRLQACSPDNLRGMIEARGVGVVPCRSQSRCKIALAVNLRPGGDIERLPDPVEQFLHGGVHVPMIDIDPFHASAPAKIETAVVAFRRLHSRNRGLLPAVQGAFS